MANCTEAFSKLKFPKMSNTKKIVDPDYVWWIRGWNCCVPGCTTPFPIEPHHVKSRRYSDSDRTCVPLCHFHHLGMRGVHLMGRISFEKMFMIVLDDVVTEMNKKYDSGEKGPMEHKVPRKK